MAFGKQDSQSRRTASGYLVCDDALGLIGGTPLIRLQRLSPEKGATVWAKAEFMNLGGSVKDRPALFMLAAAEREGKIGPGATIVEATSGNTGISLAMICALRGYRCILVMPEDMSLERRYLLRCYGAQVELTESGAGMTGAVARAEQLTKQLPKAFMPSQFENPANPDSHAETTARELLEQMPEDTRAFVAGVGTGGTFTGVGRVLRQAHGADLKLIAVEPAKSAVLSGGNAGPHGIQGLGAGFIPPVLDRALIDEIVTVNDVAAQKMVQRLASSVGLLVGPSSGANLVAAVEVASRLDGGHVVTVLCDTGERYLA